MSKYSVRLLGTSDGLPSADRKHAAILMDMGQRLYLFDCGEPVSHTLKQSKVPFESIDRLFISHLHSDHCGGFQMFIQSCWLESRQKSLPIHMPAEGIKPFLNILDVTYLFPGLCGFDIDMQPLRANRPIQDGDIRVVAHPTSHLARLQHDFGKRYRLGFEAFSFEIVVNDGKRLAYSGDLGVPEDLAPLVAKPLDLLIVELAHFTDGALFEYLKDKPIRKIVLTHMGRQYWNNPDVAVLGRRYFSAKQLVFGSDGFAIEV